MIAPARLAAHEILSAVSTGRIDLATATARARTRLPDDRDRALALEIASGVQRRRAALDHLILGAARRGLDEIDPQVVTILRSSVYQLRYLTRVPASAVVHDAVDLARHVGRTSACGFVNAVLRTVVRSRRSVRLPGRPTTSAGRDAVLNYLSITLSHPRWLAERWLDRLGFAIAERWMLFNNTPAATTLRVNTLQLSAAQLTGRLATRGVVVRPCRFAPDGLAVVEGSPIGVNGDLTGTFLVQDEASQLVALLAGPRPGPCTLDACAAPGGKATAIAVAALPSGRVVACDVRWRRLRLLRRTVEALGLSNVLIVQASFLSPPPFHREFDCVIVDAPCSGLGTLRRDPDIRWRRQEADLARLADEQRRLLQHAAGSVAPGGRLIYATCSTEPEENEHIVEQFLSVSGRFDAQHARQAHPRLPDEVIDERGYLRTTPDRHELDGFFGAVMVRRR